MSDLGLAISPSNILDRKVSIDAKKFFASLGKSVLKLGVGAYADAATELPEMAAAFGLNKSIEDRALLLILRSLERALAEIINGYSADLDVISADTYAASFSGLSSKFKFTIDSNLFSHPERSGLAAALKRDAVRWLTNVNFSNQDAENLTNRLPSTIARAMHDE